MPFKYKKDLKSYHKRYNEANKDYLYKKRMEYKEKNRDRIKAKKKEYYKRKKSLVIGSAKKYYLKRRDDPRFRAKLKIAATKSHLKIKFGLTLDAYRALFETQNGLCLICAKLQIGDKKLSVDHDHKTGKIRGLLCTNCNFLLGLAKDDLNILEAAINYLKKHDIS